MNPRDSCVSVQAHQFSPLPPKANPAHAGSKYESRLTREHPHAIEDKADQQGPPHIVPMNASLVSRSAIINNTKIFQPGQILPFTPTESQNQAEAFQARPKLQPALPPRSAHPRRGRPPRQGEDMTESTHHQPAHGELENAATSHIALRARHPQSRAPSTPTRPRTAQEHQRGRADPEGSRRKDFNALPSRLPTPNQGPFQNPLYVPRPLGSRCHDHHPQSSSQRLYPYSGPTAHPAPLDTGHALPPHTPKTPPHHAKPTYRQQTR